MHTAAQAVGCHDRSTGAGAWPHGSLRKQPGNILVPKLAEEGPLEAGRQSCLGCCWAQNHCIAPPPVQGRDRLKCFGPSFFSCFAIALRCLSWNADFSRSYRCSSRSWSISLFSSAYAREGTGPGSATNRGGSHKRLEARTLSALSLRYWRTAAEMRSVEMCTPKSKKKAQTRPVCVCCMKSCRSSRSCAAISTPAPARDTASACGRGWP